MLKKRIWGILLLLFLSVMQLTAFAAEVASGENCENGVCTLRDYQDGDNGRPAEQKK